MLIPLLMKATLYKGRAECNADTSTRSLTGALSTTVGDDFTYMRVSFVSRSCFAGGTFTGAATNAYVSIRSSKLEWIGTSPSGMTIRFAAEWDDTDNHRIIDFGNGGSGDNIVIANDGANLKFMVFSGVTPTTITLAGNVTHPAIKKNRRYEFICSIGPIKGMAIYRKHEQGQGQGFSMYVAEASKNTLPQIVNRAESYIGKSTSSDALFKGTIRYIRIYKGELSFDETEDESCEADMGGTWS